MNAWQESLVRYFTQGEKSGNALGVELEHFILERESRAAVPYSGEKGVRQVLSRLMARYPEAELLPDDDFFGFRVPDFTITLEPAAQLEISIAPMESIERIAGVYRDFRRRLDAVLDELGYVAVCAGCQPVSRVAALSMIPKRRYDLMDAHFHQFGTGGMEMMRGTCSLQISIDYHSEQDFREKLQAASYYAPMLKLFCDHSPSFQGESLKTFLKRTDIWRRVDPSRCGILPDVFSPSYGYRDYAAFLGTMPLIFAKEGQRVLPTGAQTVAELYDGKTLSDEEIAHILSMAFPDVRLKHYLEIRFADAVPEPFVSAYCALIKGLLYTEAGLSFARERIERDGITERDVRRAEDALMARGWQAEVYGQPARELADRLLTLAEGGLSEPERVCLKAFDTAAHVP